MRRLPVDSSETNLSRKSSSPISSMSSSTRFPSRRSDEHDVREVEHRGDRVADLDGPLERDADASRAR